MFPWQALIPKMYHVDQMTSSAALPIASRKHMALNLYVGLLQPLNEAVA
jgi:hypothetical protein